MFESFKKQKPKETNFQRAMRNAQKQAEDQRLAELMGEGQPVAKLPEPRQAEERVTHIISAEIRGEEEYQPRHLSALEAEDVPAEKYNPRHAEK